MPVSGRDWFETVPSVFTGRYGAASVVFNNKIWVIGGSDDIARNDVWSSPDGVTWTRVLASAPFARRCNHACVVYGGRIWVIGGMSFETYQGTSITWLNDVWSSPDGVNWTQATAHAPFSPRSELGAASFNGALWIVGGCKQAPDYYNDAWWTLDGVNWNKAPTPVFSGRRGHTLVTYNNRLWVIGGVPTSQRKADVYSTSDGNTWTTATTTAAFGIRFNHASVVHDGAMWVLGGDVFPRDAKNDVWRSTDGVNWTHVAYNTDFAPRDYHAAVEFGGEMWVMAGYGLNDVYHSADGIKWAQARVASPAPGLPNETSTVHDGKIWTIGSKEDDLTVTILQSADGANWNYVNNLISYNNTGYTSLSFNGELWIVGGSNSTVYHSRDGSAWSSVSVSATLGIRDGAAAAVFDNRMWVIGGGGLKNDVWYSHDGSTWTKATASPGFSPRTGHAALAYNGRLWVIGGNGPSLRNDIWSSADGTTWRQETAAAAFPARWKHAAAVFDGKMWVVGGTGSSSLLEDAWSSKDGIKWTQGSAAAFTSRHHPNGVAFDGKLWVLGGMLTDYQARRDIWFTYSSRPHLHLSTNALDLGPWTIGAGATPATTVTLTNDGLSTLTVRSITLGGADAAQFRFATAPVTTPMPPMTSRSVAVLLEPTRPGPLQATLSVWSNDPDQLTKKVALAGEGVVNGLNVSPLTINFGSQFASGEPGARQVLLTNTSSQPITINSLRFSGAPNFGLSSPFGTNLIEPGTTRTLEVYFRPTDAGLRVGYLEISSSSPQFPKLTIAMEGTGVATVTGRDWFEAVPSAFSPRSGMAVLNHQNKLWVIGGRDGQIRSDVWSGDGTNWTRATASAFAAREGFASTTFNGRMWVFGGSQPTHPISNTEVSVRYLPDAWSSADGVNWSAEPIGTSFSRAGHTVTEFKNKLWLIGGEYLMDIPIAYQDTFYQDVWSSNDGTHWFAANQHAPFVGRRDHAAIVFKDKLWVIGGRIKLNYYSNDAVNDVWSSADGTNWTTATTHAEFSPRSAHACFVLGDKLWLVGGWDGSGVKNNEIWNTSDGAHWTRVTPDPAFPPRADHACAIAGSEVWVIGGAYDGSLHSADGIHWSQLPLTHPGPRDGQTTMSHNGKLWVIAGSVDNQLRNDVWSSPDARTWTRVTARAGFNPTSNLVGLGFGGNMWLMGGSGRVWRSANGADWTTATTTATFHDIQGGLVHDGKMWVFSGTTCWSSTNGLDWANASGTFTGRNNMGVAALNGKMFIMGGWRVGSNGRFSWTETLSSVLSSESGASWSQATPSGPVRAYPGAASFDHRLWVVGGQTFAYGMGGIYYPIYQAPVLASFDGITWTTMGNMPSPLRSGPSMNVLGNRLYISGGKNQDGCPSDFWYTVGDGLGKNAADGAWLQYQ